jgi:hypothetical protein
VQAFNRRLAQRRNPLAFIFNCFGNADLTVLPESGGKHETAVVPVAVPVA